MSVRQHARMACQQAAVVPPVDEERVEPLARDDVADLGRVAAREGAHVRSRGQIRQKHGGVPLEQGNVPLEGDAEAGVGLPRGRLLMREVDGEVYFASQRPVERRVVLDRVRCQDTEAHHVDAPT